MSVIDGHDDDLRAQLIRQEQRILQLEKENAELKTKQVEISAAKELYLKIFEDFPALIWRSRLDKQCDYFNKTWLKFRGKTLADEFGYGWASGVHPDDYDFCVKTYIEAFDKREYFYMEYRLKDKNDEYRWIGDHGTPFFDLDNTTFLGYIGSCYDITDNKNNEAELRQLNATKDKFFSIIAHDLRNPISAFVSYSEFLIEMNDCIDANEMMEIAGHLHKDSKNTLLLLENLLDWSRTQSNKISYEPKPINLLEICSEVVDQVELCAKAKEIAIRYDRQDEQDEGGPPPFTVQADKNMIKTVIRNLIMNSIKYTNHGGTIQLKVGKLPGGGEEEKKISDSNHEDDDEHHGNDDDNSTVLVTVADNGVGMNEKQVSSLFDLVASQKSKTKLGTDNEGGSGLGLVICRDFITKHHGKIWAESVEGKGTEFKFTIPPPKKKNDEEGKMFLLQHE